MTRRLLTTIMCSLVALLTSMAQGTLDPANPPEPDATYKLTLSVNSEGAAKTLTGAGTYKAGTKINVRTTGNAWYYFQQWKNGDAVISNTANFYFIMPAEDVELTAYYIYDFNPTNPGEPQVPVFSYPLYLVSEPSGGGSFNRISGTMTVEGSKVTIRANARTGYVFEGWYDEAGALIGTSYQLKNYVMPSKATTLTARFVYNPSNPGEPSGNQENVDNELRIGDANSDGDIDLADAVVVINHYVGKPVTVCVQEAADVDGDGVADLADAVIIINYYVGKIDNLSFKRTADEKEPQ